MWLKILMLMGLLAVSFGVDASTEEISYEGYKVYEVYTVRERHHDILTELDERFLLDFWLRTWEYSEIMVAPSQQAEFEKVLRENDIPYKVQIDNVGSKPKEEYIGKNSNYTHVL